MRRTASTRLYALEYAFVFCDLILKFLILVFFSGWTPLHWSSFQSHMDVCQFLVASNADVNAKDNRYDNQPYTRI
jgi:ankyrin repeat protein